MARKLFTNARVVTAAEVFLGTVEIHADRIVRIDLGATSLPGAEDFGGDYLVPGTVDLWAGRIAGGSASIRESALVSTDLAAAVAGCTTPFSVLPVPATAAEGEAAELRRLADAITEWRQRGTLRCEHFLRLAAEGPASPLIAEFVMRLGTDLARLLGVEAAGVAARSPGALLNDMAVWRSAGLRVGVASLTSKEERAAARAGGIGLALFPPMPASVEAAVQDGYEVVATWQAIQPDRLDRRVPDGSALALASAGSPLSLLQTPFVLHDQEGWDLAAAMATVSAVPARLAGLADRGAIAIGLRADFVRVRCEGSLAVPVATWRAGQRIS